MAINIVGVLLEIYASRGCWTNHLSQSFHLPVEANMHIGGTTECGVLQVPLTPRLSFWIG